MIMSEITLEPNSSKKIEINRGKVGFLWEIESDNPIKCAVDGVPIPCGYYNPPYVIKNGITLISEKQASVIYNMETFDDIYNHSSKEDEFYDMCVNKTEETRPTRPHIINHSLTNANQWYEIRLPKDVITWQLKARGDYEIFYSFEPSHVTYMTLPSGSVLTENTAPNKSIRSVYVSCATAGVVVEIEMWENMG